MEYFVKEIKNKDEWDRAYSKGERKTFLQSWNWGVFSESMGEKIWRFGVYSDQELILIALVEKKSARRGKFLIIPHGPIYVRTTDNKLSLWENSQCQEAFSVLISYLKELARKERCSFLRLNSIWERNDTGLAIIKKMRFHRAPIQTHPEASWKLNIEPGEDVLMANTRKTTRYLIRQAEKNADITISQSDKLEDVRTFSEYHDQVSRRQRFVPFSISYLTKEFQAFAPDNNVSLFFGRVDGEIAAGSFVVFCGNTAYYHHAISDLKYAKLSTPYLLQWEAIKEAKRRGCRIYDFWGFVDPITQKNHPWAGPTLFKMGFGGYKDEYLKTYDLIISPKYWINYAIERFRRIKRGL
ncbi:MAG: peptidoglycan bridge formation glycyltransferase FemA/FemB family protein [bacterium]